MGGDLRDHINKFNKLISQLLNVDGKISNVDVVVGPARSFKPLVANVTCGKIDFEVRWGDDQYSKRK